MTFVKTDAIPLDLFRHLAAGAECYRRNEMPDASMLIRTIAASVAGKAKARRQLERAAVMIETILPYVDGALRMRLG